MTSKIFLLLIFVTSIVTADESQLFRQAFASAFNEYETYLDATMNQDAYMSYNFGYSASYEEQTESSIHLAGWVRIDEIQNSPASIGGGFIARGAGTILPATEELEAELGDKGGGYVFGLNTMILRTVRIDAAIVGASVAERYLTDEERLWNASRGDEPAITAPKLFKTEGTYIRIGAGGTDVRGFVATNQNQLSWAFSLVQGAEVGAFSTLPQIRLARIQEELDTTIALDALAIRLPTEGAAELSLLTPASVGLGTGSYMWKPGIEIVQGYGKYGAEGMYASLSAQLVIDNNGIGGTLAASASLDEFSRLTLFATTANNQEYVPLSAFYAPETMIVGASYTREITARFLE